VNFKESVNGCMLSILRRGGVSVTFEQMEAMKIDCDMLVNAIIEAIREESLVPIKKLQKATLDAFEAMEKDIEDIAIAERNLKSRILAIEARLGIK